MQAMFILSWLQIGGIGKWLEEYQVTEHSANADTATMGNMQLEATPTVTPDTYVVKVGLHVEYRQLEKALNSRIVCMYNIDREVKNMNKLLLTSEDEKILLCTIKEILDGKPRTYMSAMAYTIPSEEDNHE